MLHADAEQGDERLASGADGPAQATATAALRVGSGQGCQEPQRHLWSATYRESEGGGGGSWLDARHHSCRCWVAPRFPSTQHSRLGPRLVVEACHVPPVLPPPHIHQAARGCHSGARCSDRRRRAQSTCGCFRGWRRVGGGTRRRRWLCLWPHGRCLAQQLLSPLVNRGHARGQAVPHTRIKLVGDSSTDRGVHAVLL